MDFSASTAIGTTFRVWFRNLLPFTFLGVVLHLPLWLWLWTILRGQPTPEKIEQIEAYDTYGGTAYLLINMFLTSTFTYGVVMELRGRRASMGRSVSVGLARFLPALGVTLLVIIATLLGLVLIVIPGVIVFCMFCVAVPASVVERPGLLGAMRRSRELTMGHKAEIFGLLLIGYFALMLLGFIVGAVTGGAEEQTWESLRGEVITEAVIELFSNSLMAVGAAVVYVQLRTRKEGSSIDELARVFE